MVAPLLLDGGSTSYAVSSIASGLALLALSVPRGRIVEHFGTLDRVAR